MIYGLKCSKQAKDKGRSEKKVENMTIDFNREEAEALMECIAVIDKSKGCGILMMPKVAEFRINQVSLNDLWIKIFEAHEKKFMQISQINNQKSRGS